MNLRELARLAELRHRQTGGDWVTVVQAIAVELDRDRKNRRGRRRRRGLVDARDDRARETEAQVGRVLMRVAEATGLPVHQLQSGGGVRTSDVVRGRRIAMLVMRELACSQAEIAAALSLADHSTVSGSLRRATPEERAIAMDIWRRLSTPQPRQETA